MILKNMFITDSFISSDENARSLCDLVHFFLTWKYLYNPEDVLIFVWLILFTVRSSLAGF